MAISSLFLVLSFLPFVFFLLIMQKNKPNSNGEKMYLEYLFYSHYTLTWILYNLKYFFLFLAVYFTTQKYDIFLLLFFVFEILNFKLLSYSINLSYDSFINNKIDKMLNVSENFDMINEDLKEKIINDLKEKKSLIFLVINEFVFVFMFINTYFILGI